MKRVMHGSWGDIPASEHFRRYSEEPDLLEKDIYRVLAGTGGYRKVMYRNLKEALDRGDETDFKTFIQVAVDVKRLVFKEEPL